MIFDDFDNINDQMQWLSDQELTLKEQFLRKGFAN